MNLFHLLRTLFIISKFQIITRSDNIRLPFKIKILGFILQSILYPIGYIKNPSHNFGDRLAKCLENLGPIYIKFGQSLSTRPDLIGENVACNLRLLQDKVSPFSSEIAKLIVTQSLGKSIEELFILFEDQPVASASIAQVHKAKLHNGQFVAVKILRPLIRQKYNNDLKLLYFCAKLIAKFLPQFKRLKAIEVVDLFKATMHLELDLRLEAAALDEMRDNFILDSDVYIPKLYWTLITNQVLLVEWIDGISIYDNIELIRNNIDPELISQKIAIMFFNQAYRDGFFHADLHPGNILVTISGKIVLLDFGIMGRLSQKDRLAVAEILFAFLHRDYKLVAHVHSKAGYIKHDTNLSLFAQHCRAISESIIGLPMQEISIGKLLMQLFKITEDFGMETQPQLLLLQKTMIVVEGIGRSLNPKTNMWELAEPWIKKWALKNLTMEAKLLRTMKKIITDLTDLD